VNRAPNQTLQPTPIRHDFFFFHDYNTSADSKVRPRWARLILCSLDAMRPSDTTHGTAHTSDIVAQPPFDPKELQQPLPTSRIRVCIGVVLLISGFAVGCSSSLFPTEKLWLGIISLLLIVSSFFILRLHRLRARGRHPRKLYGDERI